MHLLCFSKSLLAVILGSLFALEEADEAGANLRGAGTGGFSIFLVVLCAGSIKTNNMQI